MACPDTVLVTGGAGFLGTWIIQALQARNVTVRSLDWRQPDQELLAAIGVQRRSVEWIAGDIRDPAIVEAGLMRCDSLVHSAGIDMASSAHDPLRCFEINAAASFRLFEAAINAGINKVVFTSSAAASCSPPTVYGAVKLAVEQSLAALWQRNGLASTSIRPFAIYGAGRREGASAGITSACYAVSKGEPFVIPFTGPSWFVPVEEVAEAHAEAAVRRNDGMEVVNALGAAGTAEGVANILSSWSSTGAIKTAGTPLPQFHDVGPAEMEADAPALEKGLRRCVDFFAGSLKNRAKHQ